MTAFPLASVQDTDCIVSMNPLVLGRQPGKYRTGSDAILARCLYAALLPQGILAYDTSFGESVLMLQGATLSQRQLRGLQGTIEAAWKGEDYVQAAACSVTLVSGLLTISGTITLVDGNTYPLELLLSAAGAALDALGGS